MTSDEPDAPVILRAYPDETSAHHARALLADNGVDAAVVSEYAGGIGPWVSRTPCARLLVRPDDAERARGILEDNARRVSEADRERDDA